MKKSKRLNADGRLYYAGLSTILDSDRQIDNFDGTDSSTGAEFWSAGLTTTAGGTTTGYRTIDPVKLFYYRRFGENKILFAGYGKYANTGATPNIPVVVSRSVQMQISAMHPSTTDIIYEGTTITSTSWQWFSVELDLSTLPGDPINQILIVRINMEMTVDITNPDGQAYGIDSYLREDRILRTITN